MGETTEPKYSQEVIRRYRELDQAGGFRRAIVEHRPVSLTQDWLRLECGHDQEGSYTLYETLGQARSKSEPPSVHCNQCIKEWLAKASEEP
jgi:hypothetical protein